MVNNFSFVEEKKISNVIHWLTFKICIQLQFLLVDFKESLAEGMKSKE